MCRVAGALAFLAEYCLQLPHRWSASTSPAANAEETGGGAASNDFRLVSSAPTPVRLCRTSHGAEIPEAVFRQALPHCNEWHFYWLFMTGLTWPGRRVGAKAGLKTSLSPFRIIN